MYLPGECYTTNTVIRYKEDSLYNTFPAVNSQLTEKLFIETDYIFDLDSLYEEFDHCFDHAVQNTKA